MTKKGIYAFKLSKEQAKELEMYFAKFPEKSKSELLAQLVMNALGLNSHLASSEIFSPLDSPKRSEEETFLQETQSVKPQLYCFSRFEHDGEFYCVNRKANAMQLKNLKICGSCQWRVEKETTKLLKKKFIAMCGAKEHIDEKKGFMLYCSKHFQGQWVTPKDCQTAKCLDLKEVKGQW